MVGKKKKAAIPKTDLERVLDPLTPKAKKVKKSAKQLEERIEDLEARNRELQSQLDYYVRLNRRSG